MDNFNGFTIFVHVTETRSIVGAVRTLGVGASAVGKRAARLEEELGVRLFRRSTCSTTPTVEGSLFLERSRRILAEIEATKLRLPQSRGIPRRCLRVSLPSVSGLILPALADFMQAYPDIELGLDFGGHVVDVVDGGLGVVLRTGQSMDSRLSIRELGEFRSKLVGSPTHFVRHSTSCCPENLLWYTYLHYHFSNTGRPGEWPLRHADDEAPPQIPVLTVCNNIETHVCFALYDQDIACLPDFLIRETLREGRLVSVLDTFCERHARFFLLWSSGRQAPLKLRTFIDFVAPRVIATLGRSAPGRASQAGDRQEQDRDGHEAPNRYTRPLSGRIHGQHRSADLLHSDQEV